MLTTPPGTSEVASTSARSRAGSGRSSLAITTAVLPVAITGATTLTSPSSEELCGASTPTTPVGSGTEKLKYGPATGLADAGHLGELVRPAGVPDQTVDRVVDRRRGDSAGQALSRHERVNELAATALEHLGHPVEDLAALVGGGRRPSPAGPCGPPRPRRGRLFARPVRHWRGGARRRLATR